MDMGFVIHEQHREASVRNLSLIVTAFPNSQGVVPLRRATQ